MPKQAASGKTKVNAFIREFHIEFISTPTDELFCKLCEKVVKHDKRFHADQHRNGSVRQAKLTIPTTSRQSFISTPNIRFCIIYDYYFAEKLPQIREIIAQFPEDGEIVTKVKHAALSPELELELTEICRCYKSLLNLIGRIEGTSYSIMQAYRDLHALQFHEDPCSISEYISNRLLGKDFLDIINCTR